jgi:hypothetical protein
MEKQSKKYKYQSIEEIPYLRDQVRYGGAVRDPAFLALVARPLQALAGLALLLMEADLGGSPEASKHHENTVVLQAPQVFPLPAAVYNSGRIARWLAKHPKVDKALKVLSGAMVGLDEYSRNVPPPRPTGPNPPDMNP